MLAPRLVLLAFLGTLGLLSTHGVAQVAGPSAREAAPVAQPAAQESSPAPQEPRPGTQEQHGHAVGSDHKSTLELTNNEIFASLHGHSVPHAVFPHVGPGEPAPLWTVYNVNIWQGIALGLLLAIMLAVSNSFHRQGRPGWLTRVFRGWCRWVRDEMVYSVMGKEEGRPWVPFFLFLFFFVTAQNLLGLIPAIAGVPEALQPTTATGTPYVTGAMAIITLGLMLFFGMKKNGVFGFWKGLLPHGLPVALIPLMVVVELTGLIVKPFALTVRLFANMLAGHLVIASSIGLVYVFTKMFGGSALSYVTAVPSVGMAAFIYIIESFVVLLQAYIFTYLSIIFLHGAMHQDH
jgi:F-type H+-transporting ATPase subunit a